MKTSLIVQLFVCCLLHLSYSADAALSCLESFPFVQGTCLHCECACPKKRRNSSVILDGLVERIVFEGFYVEMLEPTLKCEWDFDPTPIAENATFTLFSLSERNEVLYPVPGCCNVPLASKGCRIELCTRFALKWSIQVHGFESGVSGKLERIHNCDDVYSARGEFDSSPTTDHFYAILVSLVSSLFLLFGAVFTYLRYKRMAMLKQIRIAEFRRSKNIKKNEAATKCPNSKQGRNTT